MTEQQDMVQVANQRMRRVIAAFVALIAALVLAGSLAIGDTSSRRDVWRDQALAAQAESESWQDRYVELYGEFVQVTGNRPVAPTPDQVAQDAQPGPAGPRGETGDMGPQGQIGPPGPVGPQGQVGVAGDQGAQGVPGQSGADGATGATGATGPQGAPGPAGPAGPQGTTGTDGRGIASIVCDDAGRMVITLTDGSVLTPGYCTITPPITPDPGTNP